MMKLYKLAASSTWVCQTGFYGLKALKAVNDDVKKYNIRYFAWDFSAIKIDDNAPNCAFINETGEIFLKLTAFEKISDECAHKTLEVSLGSILNDLSDWIENGYGHPLDPFEQTRMKELLDSAVSCIKQSNSYDQFLSEFKTDDINLKETYASIRELLKNCED